MKNFFKTKFSVVLIIISTLVLAGIAVFTALRLYKLRQESIAPTAPESKPEAAGTAKPAPVPSVTRSDSKCEVFSFTLAVDPSPSPSEEPIPSPSEYPSPSPSEQPIASPSEQPISSPTTYYTTAEPTTTVSEVSLPEAGISTPTLFGIGIGSFLLITSFLLLF